MTPTLKPDSHVFTESRKIDDFPMICYGCLPKSVAPGKLPAKFMTLCFDCTEYGKEMAPGIVHKDGTAQPQTVNASENLYVYKALKAYKVTHRIVTWN